MTGNINCNIDVKMESKDISIFLVMLIICLKVMNFV